MLNLDLNSTYTYDNEGRMTAEQYPNSGTTGAPVTGPNLGWAYDTMGRLNTMGDVSSPGDIVSGTTYGPSGELLTISGSYSESRTYNSMLQLTHLQNGVNITYAYSATQNNGKITSQTDNVSGEQVVYTYDALNRLASAQATNNSWGQSYSYDGFGNLTDQNVIAGSAPEWHASYDPATNHGSCTDANGNTGSCSGPFGTWDVYDVENRLVETTSFEPGVQYAYAPGNKRVWRAVWTSGSLTTDEVTFWSVSGQRLAAYALVSVPGQLSPQTIPAAFYATQSGTNYYFGAKLIKNAGGYVGADRLGSIGNKYYPYGQERPSATANGTEKFTGYLRDAETGLDYADQRYHSPGTGRFLTPDPYMAIGGGLGDPGDPGSWNKYAYTGGDPINRIDPRGTCYIGTNPDPEGGGDPCPSGSGASGGRSDCPAPTFAATNDCSYEGQGQGQGANLPIDQVIGALIRAEDRIANEKCAALFFSPENNTPENRKLLAQRLQQVADDKEIRVTSSQGLTGSAANPNVPAFTTDDGVIWVVLGRAFFTVAQPNGQPLTGPFAGLNDSQLDELIIIHEFMHQTNLIGPDNGNQTYTLANGQKVTGSLAVSQAIRDNCFSK